MPPKSKFFTDMEEAAKVEMSKKPWERGDNQDIWRATSKGKKARHWHEAYAHLPGAPSNPYGTVDQFGQPLVGGGVGRRRRCKSCGRLPNKSGRGMKHPGFKAEAVKIARQEGVPLKSADAILASSSRRASTAAHRANPRLNRVGGKLGLKLGTWEI